MAAIMQPLSGISSNAPTNEEKALEPQSGTTVSGMNVFNSNKVVRKASFTRQLKNSLTSQLLADIVETVAALLGHSSTKITEKSYSHWVKGRQEKLEEAVKNSWAQLGTVEESA